MIRLCVSGSTFCSGCNPCDQCHMAIMGKVIPKAMIAGGFHEDPTQAKAFLDAYMTAFRTLKAEVIAAIQAVAPCSEKDSNGIPCEVVGPHTQHEAPKALAAFEEKRAKESAETEARAAETASMTTYAGIVRQLPTVFFNPETFVPPAGTEVVYKDSDSVVTAPVKEEKNDVEEVHEVVQEIPPPVVEGITESDDGSDSTSPESETVKAERRKQRRKVRGLPRSLRRRTGSE